METGSNSEEKEYTARDLAKIFDVTPQTIINRCKAGHFTGAEKRKSPYGEQWFVPESAINHVAQEIIPVVKVEQQLTLDDFKNAFKSVLNPLLESQQEIIEQNKRLQEQQLNLDDFKTAFKSVLNPFLESRQGIIEQNQKLQEQVAELSRKIENMEGRDHEILTQIHALAEQKKKTFWQRLLGR